MKCIRHWSHFWVHEYQWDSVAQIASLSSVAIDGPQRWNFASANQPIVSDGLPLSQGEVGHFTSAMIKVLPFCPRHYLHSSFEQKKDTGFVVLGTDAGDPMKAFAVTLRNLRHPVQSLTFVIVLWKEVFCDSDWPVMPDASRLFCSSKLGGSQKMNCCNSDGEGQRNLTLWSSYVLILASIYQVFISFYFIVFFCKNI